MRLDTLGKPPLVQTSNFENAKTDKLKGDEIQKTVPSGETETSGYQRGDERLGKILNILKRAQDQNQKNKKQLYKGRVAQAILAYQLCASLEKSAKASQTLKVKV